MENGRMSLIERVARGALGLGLLAYYGFHTSAVWALVGIIPLLTALLNFCPLYLLRRRPSLASASASSSAPEVQAPLQVSGVGETETSASEAEGEAEPGAAPATAHGKSTGHRKAKGKLRRAKPVGNAPVAGKVLHATDGTFDKLVLESPVPVLVDFWAEWCAPCRAMAPAIDELARELGDRARIVKVDVERARQVAGEYGIRSIPTLALFQGGEVGDVLVGLQSKDKLARLLQRAAN
jgi:thioredoxin 1